MPLISVQMVGVDRVQARLTNFARSTQDLRGFWNDVFAPKYFAQVQDGFTLSGLQRSAGGRFVAGTRWAPLTPAYAKAKRKAVGQQPILTRHGRLRGSLRWNGLGLGPDGIWEPGPKSVRFGTSVPYAPVHQAGRRDGRMPARPFLPPVDKQVYTPLLKKWVKEQSS